MVNHDPAFDVLLPFLQHCAQPTLWVADEAALAWVTIVSPSPLLTVLSNRFDVVNAALAAGHQAVFSDFDFSDFDKGIFKCVVYRFSKEKSVVHHVINTAIDWLAIDGKFILAGLKNDGAKTYLEKCKKILDNGKSQKYGLVYCGSFYKTDEEKKDQLDDRDYMQLRIVQTKGLDFYSKPGVFGWDSIDEGSALLSGVLDAYCTKANVQPQSLLDLGCGYGFLTLQTLHWPLVRRVATDNCAAALSAMRANADRCGISVEVVASDAGDAIEESFDMLLCNPPFHRGFSVSGDLTDKFLCAARRLLNKQGVAVFVVNGFIPLEKKASIYFSSVDLIAKNNSFSVFALRQ